MPGINASIKIRDKSSYQITTNYYFRPDQYIQYNIQRDFYEVYQEYSAALHLPIYLPLFAPISLPAGVCKLIPISQRP